MAFKMSEETRTVRVYNLRPDTNEFIGASDAWIAPHTGLPSNCTDIAPPDIPASHIAVFDPETETWSLNEDHRGETVYDTQTGNPIYISEPGPLPENTTTQPPTSPIDKFENGQWVADLNTALSQKYAEINAWRDAQENADYTFKFKEHTWDYGKASQARLQPVAALAKNGQLPDGFFWTDAHNHDVPMTAGEVLELESAMVGAMVAKGFEIHQHQRNLKEALAKLTTAEDVLAFKVE
ncbi:phage tail protein [Salmonella enterica subsp. enterica serovar Potsdam]|uniref:Phage tail protein n=1 Tax=Salmonella potsdam TaxID=597 RepID=A0A5U6HA28_SALPO|nr:phage tail protein [Salmonella enterica subsp. enterica serovar Potsdam]ECD7676016.1 DUF4376 domain-containing protein [Salmonella enterica subsp. enterica serovar Montevideo]EDT6674433.1 DUF4376 domain-containing protein [Salmonella enterica subsp. enterica]HDH3856222.1 DUF4376 domain-containing protein [Salmonella enterica subsp. enterica serovar Oranienburg]ECZ9690104.1 DUF4376 domain-containing protein [Salmonella enterica subsp. enterica serovar Potsdam]